MARYICKNCGNIQPRADENIVCTKAFWVICLVVTIFLIMPIFPILWFLIPIEILMCIPTQASRKKNYCLKCKAENCMTILNKSQQGGIL